MEKIEMDSAQQMESGYTVKQSNARIYYRSSR